MSVTTLLPINTIDPYVPSGAKPWNAQRVQHLYSRLGHGASLAEIQQGLAISPTELVDQLIDSVVNAPDPTPEVWSFWTDADYDAQNNEDLVFIHKEEFTGRFVREMMTDGVRSKLGMFWHNHFVTQEEVYYCNSSMWAYYDLIHRSVLGNFRTFVEDMGKNPAMLVYLNGNQNIADEPNENYARELMELFTMGENNGYTQNDVVEVARALTGFQKLSGCNPTVYLDYDLFDNGQKTIFGQTGSWNYNDVHELIFTLRQNQVATYICGKIYRHFVHDKIEETIVAALAQTFIDNNWELAPVFRQLFKSEHFFEARYINAKIKSPIESMVHLMRLNGATYGTEITDEMTYTMAYWSFQLGQYIFNPVDVAGWPGQRAWLNENTMTVRWGYAGSILFNYLAPVDTMRDKLRQLAIDLTDETENDPEVITAALIGHYLNTNLDAANFDAAVAYFKGEVPENYFDDGSWNLYYNEVPDQIINLLYYLTRLPEYQLT